MADYSAEHNTTSRPINNRLNRPGGPPPPDRNYPSGYADTPIGRRGFLAKALGGAVVAGAGLLGAKAGINWLQDTEDRGNPRDSLVGKPKDKNIENKLKDSTFNPHTRFFINPRTDGKSIYRTGPYQDEDSRISPEELKKKGIDTSKELYTIDVYGVTYNTDPHFASLGKSTVIDDTGKDRGTYGSWQEIVQKDAKGQWKKTGIFVPDIYIDHSLDNVKK